MQDAELKLLKAKCALLEDIRSKRCQIDYHITQGARITRELLQENRKDDIVTLDIVSLLAAFTLTSKAQCSSIQTVGSGHIAQDSTLIADETTLTYTKMGAKIITFSESAFQAITLKWGDQFKSIHIYYKNDRHGGYKEYVIYLSTQLADQIKEWAKNNL